MVEEQLEPEDGVDEGEEEVLETLPQVAYRIQLLARRLSDYMTQSSYRLDQLAQRVWSIEKDVMQNMKDDKAHHKLILFHREEIKSFLAKAQAEGKHVGIALNNCECPIYPKNAEFSQTTLRATVILPDLSVEGKRENEKGNIPMPTGNIIIPYDNILYAWVTP